MITQEQIKRLCGNHVCVRVTAVLTRAYKPPDLGYMLPKGSLVKLNVYAQCDGDLIVSKRVVDDRFPYDAAELLE